MAAPTLTYFDVRGRAEPARLILELAGAVYEENRVSLQDWPALKTKLLADGKSPFGVMPIWEEHSPEGLTVVQSHAIYRHLARKYALYGATPAEQTRCDVVEESARELMHQIGGVFWDRSATDASRRQWVLDTLAPQLAGHAALFAQVPGTFWVTDSVTYADLLYFSTLLTIEPLIRGEQWLAKTYPELDAFVRAVGDLDPIKRYMASERYPKAFTVSIAPFGNTAETS